MKNFYYLSLLGLLVASPTLEAEGKAEQKNAGHTRPAFSAVTMKAFDHSGHTIGHSKNEDGSRMAQHHGTLGHVTVARLGADGKIETICTTEENTARAWMAGVGQLKTPPSLNAPVAEK